MEVVTQKDVKSENTINVEKEKMRLIIAEFQTSKFYDLVIKTIDEALAHSEVIILLQKKNGDAPNEEIGELTKVEWMANKKITEKIKNVLTKKYA